MQDGILLTMSRISAAPILEANDAHVWMFGTDISSDQFAVFRKHLSNDENARADRFVFESDRLRFVASHGRLRIILGAYCVTQPRDLVFDSGSHGKPFLKEPPVRIQFNLSHSGSRAALVVTRNMRCGIDIEKIRPEISDQAIAARFFCSRENEWLQSVPSDKRIEGFFRLWSVKESILKADGKGMSIPLADVDTSDILTRISPFISLPDGEEELSLWVGELHATEGYTAAVALEGTAPRVRIIEADAQTN
jgi:4'-phosphopantetheinyl transferase